MSRSHAAAHWSNTWKCVIGPEPGFRVEPINHAVIAAVAAVWVVALYAFLVVFTEGAIFKDVLFVAYALVGGVGMVVGWLAIHYHFRKQGPYIVVNREGIVLPHGRSIALDDFESFDVMRKPGLEVGTWYGLALKTKSGDAIEIVWCEHHNAVAKLCRLLNEEMKNVLATEDENAMEPRRE